MRERQNKNKEWERWKEWVRTDGEVKEQWKSVTVNKRAVKSKGRK